MNTSVKNLFVLPTLIASLSLILVDRASAQIFTSLYDFSQLGYDSITNSDGVEPCGGLVLSGNTLYGTATYGGTSGFGTVFAINTDGTGFTTLYDFTGGDDGAYPLDGLFLSGNTLYGTTWQGGASYWAGYGSVFAVKTDGTDFNIVYDFATNDDGVGGPRAGLILSGGTLYGTAGGCEGGLSGSLFAVNTNGSGFTTLHCFSDLSDHDQGTNGDGAFPDVRLVLSGDTLYGTAAYGGIYTNCGDAGDGVVFAVNTNGSGFTILHYFSCSDGNYPDGGLIVSGNTLFGTTSSGGEDFGAVFSINTDGTGFTNLHTFSSIEQASPIGALVLSSNTLYGATFGSPTFGEPGTVFAVNTNGTGFQTLCTFSADGSTGTFPNGGLVLSSNVLYGTTSGGSTNGNGTVFSLNLNPAAFVAIAQSTNAAYSFDGITWHLSPTGMPSSDGWGILAFGSNDDSFPVKPIYVAISMSGDTNAAYSTDGASWVASPSGMTNTQGNWQSVVYSAAAEEFVAITLNDNLESWSTDGMNWVSTDGAGNPLSYPSGQGYSIAASTAGEFVITPFVDTTSCRANSAAEVWNCSGQLPATTVWRATYGGGKFVAVGGYDVGAYSTNEGSSWSASTLPAEQWDSVTYGGGTFVAVAWGTNNAAYSTNGVDWSESTMPSTSDWTSVAYGGGKFVAVATGTTNAAYSTNGVTWTGTTMPVSDSWSAVAAAH